MGHKWFYSVPQADAHLVLAQADEGPSCFFVPRWIPGGPRNAVRVRRLKDKLGNRSNASAEVEFEDAWGVMVGEPGRGLSVLLEMAATTRLDCVLGSAALLRQALVQAAHHARHRQAFGKPLAEQPLMRNVLADLALESEASMALALRLARAVDERRPRRAGAGARGHAGGQAVGLQTRRGGGGRVPGGLGRQRLRRRRPHAQAVPRDAGEFSLGRLGQRHGAGRAARVAARTRGMPALARELDAAAGQYRDYDAALAQWRASLADPAQAEVQARRIAAGLARLWQAALLIQHAPAAVADAFVGSRLAAGGGIFGELPAGADVRAILARAWPDAAAC